MYHPHWLIDKIYQFVRAVVLAKYSVKSSTVYFPVRPL